VTYLRINDDQGSRRNIGGKKQRDQRWKTYSLSLYRKYSTIASGATTIGSAERAPDDIITAKLRFNEMKVGTMSLSLYSK
jgi:hypothetical protein